MLTDFVPGGLALKLTIQSRFRGLMRKQLYRLERVMNNPLDAVDDTGTIPDLPPGWHVVKSDGKNLRSRKWTVSRELQKLPVERLYLLSKFDNFEASFVI